MTVLNKVGQRLQTLNRINGSFMGKTMGRTIATNGPVLNDTALNTLCSNFNNLSLNNVVESTPVGATVTASSFVAKIVQIGPNFKDRMTITTETIPHMIQANVLQRVSRNIFKTNNKFKFRENGFEFLNFNGSKLGKAISKLAKSSTSWPEIPEQIKSTHTAAVEDAAATWGRNAGIQFSKVLWIDSVYRNTAGGKFGAVHLAHCDFPIQDSSAILRGHDTWKERVVKKLGDMTTEEYENLGISTIINIWMPLDEKIVAEPLAIMDLQSLNPRTDLRVYEDVRTNGGTKYESVVVMPREQQRWYIKNDMRLGEGIIFNSCLTPHTAVSFPDQGQKTRRSIESRVLFLK